MRSMDELITAPDKHSGDRYHYNDPKVGEVGPPFSIPAIIRSLGSRGIKATMEDRAMEPHTHLMILLTIIFLIALVMGGVILF